MEKAHPFKMKMPGLASSLDIHTRTSTTPRGKEGQTKKRHELLMEALWKRDRHESDMPFCWADKYILSGHAGPH